MGHLNKNGCTFNKIINYKLSIYIMYIYISLICNIKGNFIPSQFIISNFVPRKKKNRTMCISQFYFFVGTK